MKKFQECEVEEGAARRVTWPGNSALREGELGQLHAADRATLLFSLSHSELLDDSALLKFPKSENVTCLQV